MMIKSNLLKHNVPNHRTSDNILRISPLGAAQGAQGRAFAEAAFSAKVTIQQRLSELRGFCSENRVATD